MDFAVSVYHRVKLKESEKTDKYLDFARELKKLWNMKVTFIAIVIDALGTVPKGLLKGLHNLEVGGRVISIQTTALLRLSRILRRVLERWGDLCHSKPSKRLSAAAKISQVVNNAIIMMIVCKPTFLNVLYSWSFGLVSLFNGISTLAGYLMPKLFS